ncbi:alpha/beta hydrolase [Sediminispirochaeta bajacaliforniensis]|uniref:alpha/beta hydrolase n=1 Tax=Sediminispirochaeta bajacaliforniensis TaxID=148 RepID=UPI0003651CF0|nr:alpha/beta hydrolase [Sediminispirochaeta bajacaliforniensis]
MKKMRQSVDSKRAERFFRAIGTKRLMPLTNAFMNFIDAKPSKRMRKDFDVSCETRMGSDVWTIAPKQRSRSIHIIYFHGGSYIMGFHRLHWHLIGNLARSLGVSVTAPDYPLAPRSTVKDVFDLILPLYRDISARYEHIILMGDSAGGGLSLALAQKARDEGLRAPCRLILFAPWVDVTMTNPDIAELDSRDPCLNRSGLKSAGLSYAGSTDPAHFLVSPLYGDLKSLPPITIFVGTNDMLLADCRRLRQKGMEVGSNVELHEIEGLVHPGIMLPLPESQAVLQEVAHLVQTSTS